MIAGLILAVSCLFGSTVLAADLSGVEIHGFMSQSYIGNTKYNYLTHNSQEGSFNYNEFGINFGKELTEKLRLGLQLYTRNIGEPDNKIDIDWAYGDYRVKDWFGLRAGRIKLPLGLYNETRDIDMLRTNAIMPQSIYPDYLRDTTIAANGAGVYGNVPMASMGSLDYQVITGIIDIDESVLGVVLDSEVAYVGSLKWNTPLDGLLFGISALKSGYGYDSGAIHVDVAAEFVTLSTEYTWNDLLVAAEYQQVKSEVQALGTKSKNTSEGYYVSASYRFTELFTLGTHYSIYYPKKNDKNGNNYAFTADAWEKDLALSLRFDINDYCVFKIEGHHVDGTARVRSINNTTKIEDDFDYGVAKVTLSF